MKRQSLRGGIVGAALVLVALAGSRRAEAQEAGIMTGAMAPDAMVQTLDGHPARLAELIADKPAVLEFWATWCPLCKQMEPAMKAAQEKYGKNVVFVGVGVKDNQTAERQQAYVEEHALGGQFVFDADGEAVKAFQAPHTSFVVVLDAAGKVVYTGVGGDQDLEAAIGNLMMGMGMHPQD
jgi:thiol-disulfide isomerase/thioredoxin